MRVCRDEDLLFQQAQQVRGEGPRHRKFAPPAVLVGGRYGQETEVLGDMRCDKRLHVGHGDLQTVLEQAMQQHAASVFLNLLRIAAGHEINGDRVNAVHLLIGVAAAVAYRDHQYQQIRSLFGDLREDLDEGESPVLGGLLLGVGQTVEPGLELIEQQHHRLLLQELYHQGVRKDVGGGSSCALPLAPDEHAVRMVLQQHVPQKLVPLAVQAVADDEHAAAQLDRGEFGGIDGLGPVFEP